LRYARLGSSATVLCACTGCCYARSCSSCCNIWCCRRHDSSASGSTANFIVDRARLYCACCARCVSSRLALSCRALDGASHGSPSLAFCSTTAAAPRCPSPISCDYSSTTAAHTACSHLLVRMSSGGEAEPPKKRIRKSRSRGLRTKTGWCVYCSTALPACHLPSRTTGRVLASVDAEGVGDNPPPRLPIR